MGGSTLGADLRSGSPSIDTSATASALAGRGDLGRTQSFTLGSMHGAPLPAPVTGNATAHAPAPGMGGATPPAGPQFGPA